MIKQILFDCGGVLVELNFRSMMEEISGSGEIADAFMSRLWQEDSPWLRYDSGELNTQQLETAIKAYMPTECRAYMDTFMSRWLDAMPQMPGIEEIVDELKRLGFGCYVLSNFSEGFQEMPARIPVLQKMDGLAISYETHLLKPEPAAFYCALNRFGIKAEETLFVDDNACNVEAATACGLSAYRFTTSDALRDYLCRTGMMPMEAEL